MIYWKTRSNLGACLQYGLLGAVILNFILFAIFTFTHRYLKTHAIVIINPFLGTDLSLIHVQNIGILNDKGFRIRTTDDTHDSHTTALMDPYAHISSTALIQTRNLTCKGCFKYTNEYVIKNSDICDNSTELVFLIASAVDGFDQRNALRLTWLNLTGELDRLVKHVFLLGESSKGSVNDIIVEENERHHDIIQGSFLDSYGNLTLKTRMALKWTVEDCPSVKYVMKTDDDMWINVPNIMSIALPRFGKIFQEQIGGVCLKDEKPHRDPKSKYYIPETLYSKKIFPPFCSGTGYMTSPPVVKRIHDMAENVPFFPLEDVYIGLCLEQLNLKVTKLAGFYHYNPRFKPPCWYKGPFVFTVHGLSPEKIIEIWSTQCE